jgi:hypothetical protein
MSNCGCFEMKTSIIKSSHSEDGLVYILEDLKQMTALK